MTMNQEVISCYGATIGVVSPSLSLSSKNQQDSVLITPCRR